MPRYVRRARPDEEDTMAFKPNYNQQRRDRDRAKERKNQEKQQRRKDAADRRKSGQEGEPGGNGAPEAARDEVD
jgi:hypothetical protein